MRWLWSSFLCLFWMNNMMKSFFTIITLTFHCKFQLGCIFSTLYQLTGNKLALTINLTFWNFLYACFMSIFLMPHYSFHCFQSTLFIQPLMQVELVLYKLWRLPKTFALYLKFFLSLQCDLTSLFHLVLDYEERPGGDSYIIY